MEIIIIILLEIHINCLHFLKCSKQIWLLRGIILFILFEVDDSSKLIKTEIYVLLATIWPFDRAKDLQKKYNKKIASDAQIIAQQF